MGMCAIAVVLALIITLVGTFLHSHEFLHAAVKEHSKGKTRSL